jgi:hypothetical protein
LFISVLSKHGIKSHILQLWIRSGMFFGKF